MRWRRSRAVGRLDGAVALLVMAVVTSALVRFSEADVPPPRALAVTSCSEMCADVFAAQSVTTGACVNLSDGTESVDTCRQTRQLDGVATCASFANDTKNVALCITPVANAHAWNFRFTANPELLAVAHAQSRAPQVITLDAASVTSVRDFVMPTNAWQLVLQPVDPSEQLQIALSATTIQQWQNLETLVIQNIDLSGIDTMTAFPELTALTLTGVSISSWPLMTTTSLTQLDLSNNRIAALPAKSLPFNLQTLNLTNNHLARFPVDIRSMNYLTVLSLSCNNLSSLTSFPMLLTLKELYLASNSLTTVPVGLTVLPAIKILDLSGNTQLTIPSNTLPASLQDLVLRDCGVVRIPAEFRGEKMWRFIDLSENPIKPSELTTVKFQTSSLLLESIFMSTIPVIARNWTVTSTLSLSRNLFQSIDATSLPPNITELRLEASGLITSPTNLRSLTQLRVLSLSHNAIQAVPQSSLPKELVELRLSNCSLADMPSDINAMSSSLRTLDLSFNSISSINVLSFAQLEKLYLQNNSLTTFPTEIFNLTKLLTLDLRGNEIRNLSFTQDQVAFLSTQLQTLAIDATAFSSNCQDKVVLRGTYSVCLQDSISGNDDDDDVPTSSADNDASNTKLVTALIIFAVVLVVASFVGGRKYAQRHRHRFDDGLNSSRHGATLDSTDDDSLQQWRINAEDLLPIKRLATRPYGTVWLASFYSETVLVKRINQKRISANAQLDFIRKITVLGKLEHPNIIRLIGVAWTTEVDVQMALEYMSTGNLRRYLTLTKDDPVAREWNSRKLLMALNVAHALVYLHSRRPQVLHRDLRSRSVLLDAELTAKVSGFGLRHYKSDIHTPNSRMTSTPSRASSVNKSNRCIAPEVLAGESEYTDAADMYAFGIILSELDTHELPFSDVKLSNGNPLDEQSMLELLTAGALQPTISAQCPPEVAALILDCLSLLPEHRPTATEVVDRLQSTMDHLLRLSEVGEDILSSQERMDSFLGVDTRSYRQKSSSKYSFRQLNFSSEKLEPPRHILSISSSN